MPNFSLLHSYIDRYFRFNNALGILGTFGNFLGLWAILSTFGHSWQFWVLWALLCTLRRSGHFWALWALLGTLGTLGHSQFWVKKCQECPKVPKSAQSAQCPELPNLKNSLKNFFRDPLYFSSPCFFNDLSTEEYNGKGRQKSEKSVKTLQSKVWRKVHSSVEETSRRLCIGRWGEVGVREVTGLGSTHG